MVQTKENILRAARRLFNQQGVSGTTMRNIAGAVGISQGNLTYHFARKEHLIEALYQELVANLNQQFGALAEQEPRWAHMYQGAYQVMAQLYDYRFFVRDMYQWMEEIPHLAQHYQTLQRQREQEFLGWFARLEREGLMRAPEFAGEYERLYERMNILGDNWLGAMRLLRQEQDDPVRYYCDLLMETLYPYLTEAGKATYWQAQGSR